ncbi:MAG: DUF4145 domain-containing protein [Solirubrobacteraceae bacterium]
MPTGCGHCGFEGTLERTGEIQVEIHDEEVPGYGDVRSTLYWILYRCPVCKEPTLASLWWSDEFSDPTDEPEQVYPSPRDNSALPKNVRDKYERARKVKRIDPGFYAVGIRRMLEAVCNDKGAAQGDLFSRLNDLVTRGDLAATLGDQAHQLRSLGNLGAHDKDIDVEEVDVPAIEDFADAILEYLYRAPATLNALQVALDTRKATAQNNAT